MNKLSIVKQQKKKLYMQSIEIRVTKEEIETLTAEIECGIYTIQNLQTRIDQLMEIMPHTRETCKWAINPAYEKFKPENPCREHLGNCQVGLDCFIDKWELKEKGKEA